MRGRWQTTKDNLAPDAAKMGRPQKTETTLRDALAMRERLHPRQHPGRLHQPEQPCAHHNALGDTRRPSNCFADGSCAITRQLYRGDHPMPRPSSPTWRRPCRRFGKYAEDRTAVREDLRYHARRLFLGDNLRVQWDLIDLAAMLRRLERAREAEPCNANHWRWDTGCSAAIAGSSRGRSMRLPASCSRSIARIAPSRYTREAVEMSKRYAQSRPSHDGDLPRHARRGVARGRCARATRPGRSRERRWRWTGDSSAAIIRTSHEPFARWRGCSAPPVPTRPVSASRRSRWRDACCRPIIPPSGTFSGPPLTSRAPRAVPSRRAPRGSKSGISESGIRHQS